MLSVPYFGASLVAPKTKHLPAIWETQVQYRGWEDPLEKEMATYYSTVAWKIPWTEEPGKLQCIKFQSRTRLSNFIASPFSLGAFLIAQLVKNPPAMQETPVHFLGWEDPLEKG